VGQLSRESAAEKDEPRSEQKAGAVFSCCVSNESNEKQDAAAGTRSWRSMRVTQSEETVTATSCAKPRVLSDRHPKPCDTSLGTELEDRHTCLDVQPHIGRGLALRWGVSDRGGFSSFEALAGCCAERS